ncbi:hypothetical protein PC9H_003250 [Pleurotus ostreatus]|uniref:F-box domain-containing protein n=2 Tax=Pleurotus ostreatus TaxID=5322 RepID=A0A8H7DV42_PLEOS|nr:uncharacterized protein PC9H_003250 [Pleurotus ostreatus]KAF7436417.1 hypothetical protein PC9H_003250 [Pleurotus ostreatus]
MASSHQLPSELWMEIFRWATGSYEVEGYRIDYEPFARLPLHTDVHELLSVRRVLVLVCRRWQSLAMELLYSDLIIRNHSHALHEALRRSGGEHGKRARRAILPYAATVTPSCTPVTSTEILNVCPSLQVLVRPPIVAPARELLRFEFEAGRCPNLQSLRRLEWWHHPEASRTKGINKLEDVLLCAPNLEHLFIGGIPSYSPSYQQSLHLAALKTLRLRLGNGMYLFNVCKWSLPSLTTLIIDAPMGSGALDTLFAAYGDQLRTVELGKHLGFLASDSLAACFQGCPNLEELNCRIIFTAVCMRPGSSSLRSVGLFLDPIYHFEEVHEWMIIESHLQTFANKTAFPSLATMRLLGRWPTMMLKPKWSSLYESLINRGISILIEPES